MGMAFLVVVLLIIGSIMEKSSVLKSARILIVVVVGLALAALIAPIVFPAKNVQEYHTHIVFQKYDDTIYVKRITMGIGGGHQETFVTAGPKNDYEYDSVADYYYRDWWVLEYSKNNDTLYLFVGKVSPIPAEFESKIKIVQISIIESDDRSRHAESLRRYRVN